VKQHYSLTEFIAARNTCTRNINMLDNIVCISLLQMNLKD